MLQLNKTLHFTQCTVKALFIFASLIGLSACDWFKGSENDPPEEPPQAAFSVSVNSGKAPLTVNFNDLSVAGDSNITSWLWDFGDGNTSTSANPSHSYSVPGNYDVQLTVTSNVGSDQATQTNAIEVLEPDIVVTIVVRGPDSQLLTDASATSSQFQIETQGYDSSNRLQLQVRPSSSEGMLRVSHPEFIDALVFIDSLQLDKNFPITMQKRNPPILFEASSAAELIGENGITVVLPENALQRPNGTAASGDLMAYITPVDISDSNEQLAFPGSFYGSDSPTGARDQLLSYGVVDITFEKDGEELQLREGLTAELRLPLYADKNIDDGLLQPGDQIPIWTLDENSGIWIYEDAGTVIADPLAPHGVALHGNTSHFTRFNADINPPALSGSAGGIGGGSGGSSESGICDVTIVIIGAEVGQIIGYTISYQRPGWPVSKSQRSFVYDGSPLSHPILRGALIVVTMNNGENQGTTRFSCPSGQNRVETSVTLGDGPPEFIYFETKVTAELEKENNTGPYVVVGNQIDITASFVGTDEVVINSEIQPLNIVLPKHVTYSEDYLDTDPSPTPICGVITNEHGSNEECNNITYIDEAAPEIDLFYMYRDQNDETPLILTDISGADTARVEFIDSDPEGLAQVSVSIDPEEGLRAVPELTNFKGYMRLIAENQYGVVEALTYYSGIPCPPFSEDPNCQSRKVNTQVQSMKEQ